MFGYYSPSLVALSIAIAVLASYTALDLANRVKEGASDVGKSWAWLVAGALSMGSGIWSMHFIGMLAFHLPIAVAYDLPITALSLVIAIAVSTVALAVFRQPELRVKNVLACALLMGIGIAAMHYTGMIAMRMSPPIAYDPVLFVASVLIAVLASAAALWIAFMLRKSFARLAMVAKLAGAGVMGLAIAGMHYTGMAAARFAPDSICLAAGAGGGGISNTTLGLVIGGFAMVILSFTLILSTLDAHFAAKITLLARTDSLTGLANRATFTERLAQSFAAAGRGATPFAILMLDLDKFKPVNDTFGHPVGDLLLLEVAERLERCTRETDLVARLGGDEFAVLQGEVKEPANAGALADKIQSTLALPYLIRNHELRISVSIGISCYVRTQTGPDAMLAQADLALYRSKHEGRNRYHFHSDALDQEVLDRLTFAGEVVDAISRGEFELRYQPQVELSSQSIVGMEALIRWNHPTRGVLAPGIFIPAAEKTGAMAALGHWVLDSACRQMSEWRKEGLPLPVVAVNHSLLPHKSGHELVRDVTQTLAKWNLVPSDLEIDVTEAMLAQLTLTQNEVLPQLRQLGVKIAIDDFGSEYSSFDYIRAFRVNHLKLDPSLIGRSATDPESAATIRAIVSFAHDVGITVIAQGVAAQQRDLLTLTNTAV
jgi:diguanylate cyclase (GGDEF)-like protein